jgi:hypothetical protein
MASTHAGRSPGPPDPSAGRPAELQDPLNRFVYHPLAARLARLLARGPISPNAVSVAGMLLVWGAALAYTRLDWPVAVLCGFALHLSWHVVDGADGDLARLTGKASPTGELVDGVCDYAGHVGLYLALAAMLDDQIGGWAWLLASAAGASHIAQTNHAESQRRYYLWWAYGVPWLKHARAQGNAVFAGRSWFSRLFGWMARDYLKLADAMTPYSATIDTAIERVKDDPARIGQVRRLVRRSSRRSLAFQKLLGPNPRAILLGISMAFATPLYFFLAEAVLLNLLLVLSVRHHNRSGQRMARQIG